MDDPNKDAYGEHYKPGATVCSHLNEWLNCAQCRADSAKNPAIVPDAIIGNGVKMEKDKWPECWEFYHLMQTYRHMSMDKPAQVREAYEAVKTWIRAYCGSCPDMDKTCPGTTLGPGACNCDHK